MPIIINELVIKTNIEQPRSPGSAGSPVTDRSVIEEMVKQAVEKVLEILEEKKER
jgi:hypothetical protein